MRGLLHAVRIALVIMLALPGIALAQGLIVTPGRGIGPWTLDRKLTDYIWKSGDVNLLNDTHVPLGDVPVNGTDPEFSQQLAQESWQEPNELWVEPHRIFVVYPPTSNTIWAFGTTDPAAQTIEHIGLGSTQDQVTGAYQAPQFTQQLPLRSRTLIYDARGVAFEFDFAASTGQYATGVGRVWVFRPGQARAIWRLP
jgi:hypothetical protein